MPRGPRVDYPGALHHVFNRGAARRTVFENSADMRAFQASLARTVRAGYLDVHAFALLTTHYHILVASPIGRLDEAMRRIGNSYVRRFNRQRRRDGPLMRGRYGSKLIESAAYFRQVVRYIDLNPVDAGLAKEAHRYRHASAWHFARSRRPPWLSTKAVEALVCDTATAEIFRPEMYPVFAAAPGDAARELVEARLTGRPVETDPLDDLVRAAPLTLQRWMRQRCELADGTSPGVVVLSAGSILAEVDRRDVPDPPRRTLVAGLLRDLAGLRLSEIASRSGLSKSTAHVAAREHRIAIRTDCAYVALAADIVHAVIRRDFGPPPRLFDLPRRPPQCGFVVEDVRRGFLVPSSCGKRDDGV